MRTSAQDDPNENEAPAQAIPVKNTTRLKIIVGMVAYGGICLLAGIYVGYKRGIPFVDKQREWAVAIYQGPTPFEIAPRTPDDPPALTAADVTDVSAKFVADPFIVHHDKTWYLFVEVLNNADNKGDIGVATSTDTRTWQYRQIVLDEPFHLSYPHVFAWQGTWYMVPESFESQQTRLYRATDFPTKWQFVTTLVHDDLVDPTVFRYNNHWWMFASASSQGNGKLVLYHADQLTGPWRRHPKNPIVIADPNIARPGGSVITVGDKLYRFAQDDAPSYGLGIQAFEITTLTTTDYAEKPCPQNPILTGTGYGWNAGGMHQLDAHQLDNGQWIAAVDGHYLKKYYSLKY